MHGSIRITALVAALAFAGACGDDGEQSAAARAGNSAAERDVIEVFPDDTTGLAGVAVAPLSHTQLFKRFAIPALKADGTFARLNSECGIEPLSDVTTVVVGTAGFDDTRSLLVMLDVEFDRAKAAACMEKLTGKKPVEDGPFVKYESKGGAAMYGHWLTPSRLLLATSRERLQKAASSSLADSAQMKELLGEVDTSATLWALGTVPGDIAAVMSAAGGEAPRAAYTSIAYKSSMKIHLGLRYDSKKAATAQAKVFNKQLEEMKRNPMMGQFGSLVSATSYKTRDRDVVVDIRLSAKDIDTIARMLPLVMGGM